MKKMLIQKDVLEMYKTSFNIHAKKIFYLVLESKKNEIINNEEIYNFDGTIDYDKLECDEIVENYIGVELKTLKKIFKGRKTFNQIFNYLVNIPYMVKYFSSYDEDGNYLKTPKVRAITIFTDIIPDEEEKIIYFKLYKSFVKKIFPTFQFTNIDVDLLISLKTDFQIRLYEYISEFWYYDNDGNKVISDHMRKMKTEKFKNYFGINNNYNAYDMYSKLFLPAIKAINKNEMFDYDISFHKLKLDTQDGKKISHYRIDVERKKR